MVHLIDKDALVAEIERRIKSLHQVNSPREQAVLYECKDILSFVNTLEVREVNFGTEIYKYIDEHFNVYDDGNQTLQTKDKKSLIGRIDVENIAKHFFELGMCIK